MSDTLLSLIQADGDERGKAILKLWRLTHNHVRKVVRKGRGNEADIEDVMCDATVVLLAAIDKSSLRAKSDGELVSFFKQTSEYTWYNKRRKADKHPSVSPEYDVASSDKTVEEAIMQFETESASFQQLKACLDKMDEKCREIIGLRFRDGKAVSWDQIAGKLGYKDSQNAQNKGGRCMKKLRSCMAA